MDYYHTYGAWTPHEKSCESQAPSPTVTTRLRSRRDPCLATPCEFFPQKRVSGGRGVLPTRSDTPLVCPVRVVLHVSPGLKTDPDSTPLCSGMDSTVRFRFLPPLVAPFEW